jgi:acetyl esterase/lipase
LTVPRALMNLAARAGRRGDVEIATVTDDVAVRVHRSIAVVPGPALLWIHGGGMVMGSAAQEDRFCRKLMNFTDVAVAAVDHRLAPEHPYPTPLEDCYAALLWLARQPWVDPTRIAIGGASAGGGLTAALAHLARDRGTISPALQMMVYPMLDDRTGARPDGRSRIMWSETDNQLAWQWYLGGVDPQFAVPARRGDLTNLPPAWIGVGTLDLFYDESVIYGRRLREAGIATHVEIVHGAFHAFDLIASNAPVSQRFFASQCRAVRSALFPAE